LHGLSAVAKVFVTEVIALLKTGTMLFSICMFCESKMFSLAVLTVPDQSLRGDYMLCFLDDGQGMSPGTNALSFLFLLQKYYTFIMFL